MKYYLAIALMKKYYFRFVTSIFLIGIGVLIGLVIGSPYFHSYQPNYRSIQP